MNIFEKESFTLKEFCNTFYIKNENNLFYSEIINNIIHCYILFSSDNQNYRKYLKKARENVGRIYLSEDYDKYINFREILQLFDMEFTKLIIRIKTDSKKYDINVSWNDFEKTVKNIKKSDLYFFYKSMINEINTHPSIHSHPYAPIDLIEK